MEIYFIIVLIIALLIMIWRFLLWNRKSNALIKKTILQINELQSLKDEYLNALSELRKEKEQL
jgi:dolichyl-phosphate-mannose--protein O-mannosyl transferase